MAQRYSIGIGSDLAVVGYNPEAADMDRPRGEIIRDVFYLLAEDDMGRRWTWGAYRSHEEAELAIALAPPVILWNETRPAYGSQAYVAYGQEDDLEAERRMADDEAWGFDTRFGRYY